MVTIRPARSEDADRLPEVERDAGTAFRSLPDLAWLADEEPLLAAVHLEHIETCTVWVAEGADGDSESEALLGFLTAQLVDEQLHILEVSVRRSAQGRGLGRRLIAQAVTAARERKLEAVTLTTFRNVPWNAPFYSRIGFEVLEDDQLDERLREILRLEADHGLPPEQRCAMRLRL